MPRTPAAEPAFTLDLRQPIELGTQEPVTQIEFKDPVARDFIGAGGMPAEMVTDADGLRRLRINPEPMAKFLGALAMMPPSYIGQLHPLDFQYAAWWAGSFFIPVPRETASPAD